MTKDTFGYCETEEVVLSVFKRCTTILVCKHRLVLRLPSEDRNAKLNVFIDDDIAKDLLKEDHKPFLSEIFKGIHVKFGGFDAKFMEEAVWAEPYITGATRAPSTPMFRAAFDICAIVLVPPSIENEQGTPMWTLEKVTFSQPFESVQEDVGNAIKQELVSSQTRAAAILEAMRFERCNETITIDDDDDGPTSSAVSHSICAHSNRVDVKAAATDYAVAHAMQTDKQINRMKQ